MYVDGVVYFVTARIINNKKIFNNDRHCRILLNNINYYRNRLKFRLYAYCVIPCHVHLLILPKRGRDISKIMQLIKYRTARDIRRNDMLSDMSGRRQPGCRLHDLGQRCEHSIWQRSFYDRIIRSDEQMCNTINYINYNAAHHHLVDDPLNWPYTSFHNYDKTGQALLRIDYYEG